MTAESVSAASPSALRRPARRAGVAADRVRRAPRLPSSLTGPMSAHGHIVLAVIGAGLFVLARPAVADLQAADARAAAAARGVGLSYWLSWYAGTAPGDYSILTPTLTARLGVATSAALAVVAVAVLARPLLAGSIRPRSSAYLLVACAMANLWSGRVPFALGAAFSLAALLALLRHRPWLSGALNGIAAIFSPLAPVMLLLGLSGVAVTQPARRPELARFALVSAVGLAAPAIAFGMPGRMIFPASTLGWTLGIIAAVFCLRLPQHLRIGLCVVAVAAVGAFFIPNGVGANIARYAFLAVPALVWSLAHSRARLVALALIPALVYSGYNVGSDLVAAAHPAARQSFYTALRTELVGLPGLHNHRVEVIDTATHRAAAELVPEVYLARGWEDQSDTTVNPIFYSNLPLTGASYRQWLDGSAVAWVAVPAQPSPQNVREADLVAGGLPYLHEIWHDAQWRLYAVDDAQPIVSPPAELVSATETTLVVDVPEPGLVTFKVHPSRYLRLVPVGPPNPPSLCLTSIDPTSVSAMIGVPGRYELDAPFSVSKMLGATSC